MFLFYFLSVEWKHILASTDKCKGTSGHKIGFFGWTKFLEKIETTGAMDSGEGFLLQKAQGLAPLHTHFNNPPFSCKLDFWLRLNFLFIHSWSLLIYLDLLFTTLIHNRFTTKKHDTYPNLILKCMHTNPMYSFDSSSKFGSGQLSFLSCKTSFLFLQLLPIMTLCVSNSLCPLFCGPAVVCLLARQHSCSISMQPYGKWRGGNDFTPLFLCFSTPWTETSIRLKVTSYYLAIQL